MNCWACDTLWDTLSGDRVKNRFPDCYIIWRLYSNSRGRWRTLLPFSSMHIHSFLEREHLFAPPPSPPPSIFHLYWRSVLNLLGPATPRLPRSHSSSSGGSGQRVDSGRQCRKFRQTCQISFFSESVFGLFSLPPHRHSHRHSSLLRPRPAFQHLGGELEGKGPVEQEHLRQSTLTY